jgi:geranylgeranyl diphosphate synthase type I
MDFKQAVRDEKLLIEKKIEYFMDEEIENCLEDPLTREMMESIKEYTLRDGKRIRAILLVKGYQAVGGKDLEGARKASVCLELIQSMLLIHDDIIDSSAERRGGPSLHVHYRDLHRKRKQNGPSDDFGTNMAIIGGDLAESLGEKALVTSTFPPERIIDALRYQTDMIRDTGFGQILDLYSEALPEWSENMVLKVQKYKTARYTLEGPLHIGAVLNGASDDQMKALSDYAIPVGIAFQIIDDILGFYGDPKRGGKEDLADIKEGKRTLLIMKALELAREDEKAKILIALGNKDLTVEDAEEVREIIRSCGSEEYSRKMAKELSEQGIKALDGSILDEEVIEFLKDLCDYLLSRA